MSNELKTVPLSALTLSNDNVRSHVAEDAGLPALEASIRANGVIVPLIVVPATGKTGKVQRDKYAVIAGGRRYRALRNLANALEIGENYEVPVSVRNVLSAVTEISLTENVLRAALRPHEEYAAFAKMARDGIEVAAIADHFGTTVRRVEQLLRLGNLAEPIAEAFATGKLRQEEAHAYASTSDTALQLKVFNALSKKAYYNGAYEIRSLIQGDGSALLGKLRAVGLEAYRERGGRFDADLFGKEELVGRVLDPDILEVLFASREAAAIAALKEQLPQVELVDGVEWNTGQRIEGEPGAVPPELAEKFDELTTERDKLRGELDALCDADGDLNDEADMDKASALEDRISDLDDEIEAIQEKAPLVFPEVVGAKIVATPRFNPSRGDWVILDYRVVPAEWTPENPVEADKPAAVSVASRPVDQSREAQAKAAFGLSGASIETMRAHRQRILQALLLTGSQIDGRDFLAFAVIRSLRTHDYAEQLGIAGRIPNDASGPDHAEANEQPAYTAIERFLAERDDAWLKAERPHEALALWLALDWKQRAEWQSYASALVLSRSLNFEGFACPVHDVLAHAIDASPQRIRSVWTPDAAFWARIPKKHRIAALEAIDPKLAELSKKLGNEELIERCVGVFSGDQAMIAKYVPEGQAARAATAAALWVPEYLLFPVPPADEADDDEESASRDAEIEGTDELQEAAE